MADIDGDGDLDLVAGNQGLNSDYRVSAENPMQLFSTDLDGNGSIDPVLFYYIKDNDGERRLFPAISKGQFARQVPSIKKQFLYNKDYAHATFDDIFQGKAKGNLLKLTCNETRSCYFENMGNGKFIKHPLPVEAQFAPVNAIICTDVDNDGFMDLLLAGNEYQAEVMKGRYDASYGCFLKGNGSGFFKAVPPYVSGLILNGDVKDMALIHSSDGQKMVIVAINNDSLRVFKLKVQR
jgi:enediyne biosynthesis protein E4